MEKFFVSRPIFAISLAIVIVLVGLISIMGLPIEQYPDITPPVVEVSATYDGADAETVNNAVATPVAQAVMGVSDMLYMQATSANDGSMVLQVTFDIGSDPDLDAIFTQNNVSSATAELPATVTRQGVTTRKTMTGFLMVYSLHSDGRYDGEFLSNYAYINLQNELLKIDGVGKVSIMGAGEYAMRIWVKPDLLNYYNVSLDELRAAVLAEGGPRPAPTEGIASTATPVATAPAAVAPVSEISAAIAPTGANPAAAVPAGSSPVGGDLGRPSAPAGSAPCDSQSVPLAEGGSASAPTEGVAPTATPVAVAPAPSTASASAPAPSAPAAAGSLSPEIVATLSNMAALQRLWAGVLASLKKSKAAYGVLFMNTKAVFDAAAGALLIEFPAENDFAFRAVQKPDVQAELAQALRREAHGDIPFELRKGGASAPMASAPAAASAFNAPAPIARSVPAPSAASSAASASPMSGAPSSVSAPAVPASAAASPAPAPDDDRPPYDDYVPYDDADIPFEDPFAARAASPQGAATSPAPSVPAHAASAAPSEVPPWEDAPQVPAPSGATPQAPASAPAPSPAPSMAAPSASALPPEPDAVSGPSPNPVEEPDLAASLAFGFGDGVNFEEVI